MENYKSQSWMQIIIDDPLYLPGKSISNVIQLLTNVIEFKYIILDDIYGVSEAIANLEKIENIPHNIDDKILNSISIVNQFDWGDFFLFITFPINWRNVKGMGYPDLLIQTDTAVRAVDDQYIY